MNILNHRAKALPLSAGRHGAKIPSFQFLFTSIEAALQNYSFSYTGALAR